MRPGSSLASCAHPSLRLHRRGRRSAVVRLRRGDAWRARCERQCENLLADDNCGAHGASVGEAVENDNAQENREESLPRRTGQPRPPTLMISNTFTIFQVNPQVIQNATKLAKFDTLIQQIQQPTGVGVTDTWLDKRTAALPLSGYTRVSRLDRRVGELSRGGSGLFVLE